MAPRPLEAVVQDALTTTTAGATCAALVMSMLHRACLPITPAGRARMAAPPVRLPAGAHAHRR
jgi:hypothetical protein